ncbi:outer membrane protein assembly factor BamE [Pelagibacteraceae bacterium]|jgi:outer membrane protein assembly factor BamE (lipoprotein component of BamABCDE complex)|nr:outer membrane protein assembly factor BamE [Pelagibacteraceae bacterium]MDC0952986.1 outer membrane protein assembly factor BamE [Pelagibacteraceae bacterium]
MLFRTKYHFSLILIFVFFILYGCQLQDPSKTHGIVFLKNRSEKLTINKSNKNDVLQIIGQPHSKSINNDNEWIYIERILTKGAYHKLGQNVLKSNNVLILYFNKYGILTSKKFLDKDDKQKIVFSKAETENDLTQKSFVEKFLSSIRSKMYGKR